MRQIPAIARPPTSAAFTRPQGDGCDIGAVEFAVDIFRDRFEATSP
jgi:hypothetical protein